MEVLLVLVPFIVAGIVVIFIAFSGSPGAAREAYLTRGGRLFTFVIVIVYAGLGIALPAAVIAARGESEGGVGPLRTESASKSIEEGKTLFIENCKSCHTLAAVQAHGVTGPDLDELAPLDKQRVLNAIKRGGTGQDRMPSGLLQGEDAQKVATYVSQVAGQ
jgi:cytochrome c553